MKKLIYRFLGVFILAICFSACNQLTKATDLITNPTPREVYKRNFKDDTLPFNRWQHAFKEAFNDSIEVRLPYLEQGLFNADQDDVYNYTLSLKQGEVLHLEVDTDSLQSKVFIDLYRKTNDSLNPYTFVTRSDLDEKTLDFTVDHTGDYKIFAQPELKAQTPFVLKIYRTPLYHFPVSGKGNAAIQSFWGASRDGGRRRHEGLDIFADRGTPVVAATDGWVSSTGNRGLGGKQVWLRAGLLGNSLYYAHLDSIAVNRGQRVQTGDTLGFVGNTGNARTTPPHLHFGIYRRGAINPLPYVFEGTAPLTPKESINTSSQIVVKTAQANLRNSAFAKAKKIGQAKRNDTLKLLGESAGWLHIQTPDNQKAFMHSSLAKWL